MEMVLIILVIKVFAFILAVTALLLLLTKKGNNKLVLAILLLATIINLSVQMPDKLDNENIIVESVQTTTK